MLRSRPLHVAKAYFAVLSVLASVLAIAPPAAAWAPPPPYFQDETEARGLHAAIDGWSRALGDPESLLDLVPPGGLAWGDVNADSFPDLFVPVGAYTNPDLQRERHPKTHLYLNDGTGNFDDVAADVGVQDEGWVYSGAFVDYDGDGCLDLFTAKFGSVRLFRNKCDLTFEDKTADAGLANVDGFNVASTWADYDGDGDLDVFLARFAKYALSDGLVTPENATGAANLLLRNDDGVFTDVTSAAKVGATARRSVTASFQDYDADGDADLFVANYYEADELFRNNGDGTFTDVASTLGLADARSSGCATWGDLNADGRPDLFVTRGEGERSQVFLNTGTGFNAITPLVNDLDAVAWGCVLLDHEMDGNVDLFATTGHTKPKGGKLGYGQAELLTVQERPNIFKDYSASGGPALPLKEVGRGLAAADIDHDGDLDLALANGDGGPVRLIINANPPASWYFKGNYFFATLVGSGENPFAVGAKVTMKAGKLQAHRQMDVGTGYGSGSLTPVHGGYAKDFEGGYRRNDTPITLTVKWPGGSQDVFTSLPMGYYPAGFNDPGRYSHVRVDQATKTAVADAVAPRVTATVTGAPGANGWYVSESVDVALSVEDFGSPTKTGVKSWEISIDGGPRGPYTGPFTLRGEAKHVVTAWTEDHAGNRAVFRVVVGIDLTAPDAGVAKPEIGFYVQDRGLATLPSGSPGAPVLVSALPVDFRNLATVVLDVDKALGTTTGIPPLTVVLGLSDADGKIPPEVQALVKQATGSPVSIVKTGNRAVGSDGRETVRAAAEDATSGVWYVEFHVDGVLRGTSRDAPYEYRWDAGSEKAGEHTLRVVVHDVAGHASESSRTVYTAPTGPSGVQKTPPSP